MNYSNIKLVPRHLSSVKSRDDVDLSIQFGTKRLRLPILVSPMNTITGMKMVQLFNQNELLGCLPRQGDWENSIDTYINVMDNCIISVGLDDFSIAKDFYKYGDIRYFLVDTANGFNTNIKFIIEKLKQLKPVFIIAGNVASREGYKYLADLGVDAIRVGIGTGSPCLTTPNTGIGTGMVSTIMECYEESLKMINPPLIIADGGIKSVGDIAKAIAVGADLVMIGGMFAGCKETPGNVIMYNGKRYKTYHGSASYAVQAKHKEKPYYIEGMESLVEYKGTSQKVLDKIDGGLRSTFSYMGALNITEFKENCQSKDCIKFI